MKASSEIARCAITSPMEHLLLSRGQTDAEASTHRSGPETPGSSVSCQLRSHCRSHTRRSETCVPDLEPHGSSPEQPWTPVRRPLPEGSCSGRYRADRATNHENQHPPGDHRGISKEIWCRYLPSTLSTITPGASLFVSSPNH